MQLSPGLFEQTLIRIGKQQTRGGWELSPDRSPGRGFWRGAGEARQGEDCTGHSGSGRLLWESLAGRLRLLVFKFHLLRFECGTWAGVGRGDMSAMAA